MAKKGFSNMNLEWSANWSEAKQNLVRWWNREGMAISLTAWRKTPALNLAPPSEPENIEDWWTDPLFRCNRAEYEMSYRNYLAEAIPYFDTQIGPGSLGLFLGATPRYDEETVWYEPCIHDPQTYGSIHFSPENNLAWKQHLALIEEGLRRANGRYMVSVPDLIENLDTLAALRGDTPLLYDLTERPGWVIDRLVEINQAYFQVFNLIYEKVKDDEGGNVFSAFSIWGPGKTAKLQCDISAALSPRMFKMFVKPILAEQCRWLDYSLYHLDGTTCLQHLDLLLSIEDLNAIEWTPQAGRPGGGSAEWYDLYRYIKAGGKGVQVIGVLVDEVIPLLDAIGPQGVFILLGETPDQETAEKLLQDLEPYRKG